jgi:thiol-disulfide isomerase/thioredoxin
MKRMKNRNSQYVLKLVLILVLICVLIAPAACAITENSSTALIDNPAPDFSLKDLDGERIKLSGLPGKTVLINFWATTCPPCVAEMPIFQELYEEWEGRSEVVFISINLGEDAAKVRLFKERHNLAFPVWLDTEWEAGRFYQIHYIPTTCLVDNQGFLRFSIAGPFKDKAALDKQLSVFISPQP